MVVYAVAIPVAFAHRRLALALYVAVAPTWLVPDARPERTLVRTES